MPRRFVYLDTEAHIETTAGVQRQTWRLGCTAYENRERDDGEWSETDRRDWHDPQAMWEYVSGLTRKRQRSIVFAHNVGYDLRISRALEILPALGWQVSAKGVGGRNLTMTLRRDGATLVLCDFLSWLPMSLSKVGTLVGADKTPLPHEDDPDELWLDRCRQDVEILRLANRQLIEWITADSLGNWQKTGAGMAWANWRHLHYSDRVLSHSDDRVRALEVSASATGRCEAYRHGRLPRGFWYEWDLPLAYPRVCLDTELPTVLIGHDWAPTWAKYEQPREGRRALISATVTTNEPLLPVKGENGWLWPVGTFSGDWWDNELRHAASRGAQITTTHAVTYRSAPALANWAEWIIGVVEGTGDDYSRLQRAAAKHWARALIGRFGAKFPTWLEWGQAPKPGLELVPMYDLDTGKAGQWLTIGETCYLSDDEQWVADAAPAIMGAVMAECRIRLWELCEAAGWENVAYVDTDSLMVNSQGNARLREFTSSGAGWGVRVKSQHKYLTILGPRQMIVEGHGRIAGVPKVAVQGEDGKWYGERWDGVTTTLATRQPGTVIVRPAAWQIEGVDNRRTHLAGGATAPIVLGSLQG